MIKSMQHKVKVFVVSTFCCFSAIVFSNNSEISDNNHKPKLTAHYHPDEHQKPSTFQFSVSISNFSELPNNKALCLQQLFAITQQNPPVLEAERWEFFRQILLRIVHLLGYAHTEHNLNQLLGLQAQYGRDFFELGMRLQNAQDPEAHTFNNSIFLQNLKDSRPDQVLQWSVERTQALDQTLARSGLITTKTYQLSQEASRLNPHAEYFHSSQGNALEHQLHNELLNTVNDMARLLECNPHNLYVQTNSVFVFHVTALAKAQNNPEVAFNLADFASHLLTFTKNLVSMVGHGIAKGGARYIESNIEMIQALFSHPVGVLEAQLLDPLFMTGYGLSRATVLLFTDPKQLAVITKNGACAIAQVAYNDPSEVIAFAFQLFAPSLTSRFAKLRHIQPIVKAFDDQKKIATAFAARHVAKHAQKIVNPMKTIAKKSQKKLNTWLNKAKKHNMADLEKSSEKLQWTNHGRKHVSPKNKDWNDIVKSTKYGKAKYKSGINIQEIEKTTWDSGILVEKDKCWKVKKFDNIIGAKRGEATQYMRVEMSAGTIHGHPITEAEYKNLTKKR